jgi:hypothetical protein
MNIHKNARLTPMGRERLVRQCESGQTAEAVARAAGICPRAAGKWLARFGARVWPGSRIARRGPIACIGRRRPKRWSGSKHSGVSA